MPIDPVIIKLQLDDTELKSGTDRLKEAGQIDEQNAAKFSKSNEVLKERNTILTENSTRFDKLTASVTPQQAAFNKLTAALKELVGTSKLTAEQLLKLGAGTLFDGLKGQNQTIDQFILKLKTLQVDTANLPANFEAATATVNTFIEAAKKAQQIPIAAGGGAGPLPPTPLGPEVSFSTAAVEKAREEAAAVKDIIASHEKLTATVIASVTPQQVAFNKLTAALKDLFGTSKLTAEQLLKLGSGTLFDGLQGQNETIDQFIVKLRALQVGTKELPVNFDAATATVNTFIEAAKKAQDVKLPTPTTGGNTLSPKGPNGPDDINTSFSTAVVERAKEEAKTIKDIIAGHQKLTATITPEVALYNKLAASVKNLSGASKDTATQLLKLSANDLAQGFAEGKINMDEFVKSLEEASGSADGAADSTLKLRTELLAINDALTKLSLNGQEGSQVFQDLSEKSKVLTKALNDQRERTKNLASDTPALSALQSGVEGLTGAFEVGIGLTGLFGEKNKDLEEVLIRVNSIMVFAQGAQAVFNTLKKESALRLFLEAQAHAVDNAQKEIDIALTSKSTVVRQGAIIAQKALNATMAANPIGIVVAALSLFVIAMGAYFNATVKAREEQEKFNDALRDTKLLDEHNANLQRNSDFQIELLKKRNAKESEITQEEVDNLRQIIKNNNDKIVKDQELLNSQRLEKIKKANAAVAAATAGSITVALEPFTDADKKRFDDFQADITKRSEENQKKSDALQLLDVKSDKVTAEEKLQIAVDMATAILNAKVQGSEAFFASERVQTNKQLAFDLKLAGDNEGKKALVRSQAAKKFRDIDAAEQQQAAADELARDQISLIKIQTEKRRLNTQISEEESIAEDKILVDQTARKIAALKVQANQDKSFRKEANIQIALLQAQQEQILEESARQRQIRRITAAAQDQIAINNIQLAGVKATNAQRLELEVKNLQEETTIALENQSLTENQRLAIIAQAEEKETQLRNAFVQKRAHDEIEIAAAVFQAQNDTLERQLAAQDEIRSSGTRKKTVADQLGVPILNIDQQKAAIDTLTQAQLDANFTLIKANLDTKQSDEDKAKNDLLLQKQRDKIISDGSERKRKLEKGDAEFQRQQTLATIDAVSQGAQKIIGFLDQVFAAQDQAEQQRLDAKKQRIQDELDAGNISQKEATKRQKEADAEQKKLQVEQAKRQKEIALFTAIINTASAIAVALTGGPIIGVINAAIAAAIGVAQIALIASTPLPTFSKGKNKDQKSRDMYEGWGVIGEDGAELWKSGSQMKYADKQTIVWLKRNDVVYTPAQTKEMMGPAGRMNSNIPVQVIHVKDTKPEFNYRKLGEEIAKRPLTLNIDGYKEFIKSELDYVETLNARRSWSKR